MNDICVGDWVRLRRPYRGGDGVRYRKGIVTEILWGNYRPIFVLHFPRYRNRDGSCVKVDFGRSAIERM